MGVIISLGIQKGGCGKTTTTGMLSHIMAKRGYKVLAVDFDSQGNLTRFLSQRNQYDFQHRTALEACKERDPRPYIVHIRDELYLLPAEDFLSKFAQYALVDYPKELRAHGGVIDPYAPSKLLKETLEKVKDDYDFIFIDLPPNLGEQTINGMAASDFAIVVLQSEPFCKSALERYLETLESSIDKLNPNTRLLGILTAMIDARISLAQHILEETKEEYGDLVLDTVIRRRAVILEYSYTGIADATTKDAKEAQQMYVDLADEVLRRAGIA